MFYPQAILVSSTQVRVPQYQIKRDEGAVNKHAILEENWQPVTHVVGGMGGGNSFNPIQTGGGGLFKPPLRQNRDNSYTERAMTFKFSDFS